MDLSDLILEINKIFNDDKFSNKNFSEFSKIIQNKKT